MVFLYHLVLPRPGPAPIFSFPLTLFSIYFMHIFLFKDTDLLTLPFLNDLHYTLWHAQASVPSMAFGLFHSLGNF